MAKIANHLEPDDETAVRTMITWFDRSSLWPSSWRLVDGELELLFANEAERYAVSLTELHALYAGMRQGRAVNWDTLRKER